MDAKAQQEIESIKREIQSIIVELENIASGIKRDFVGIGNEKCALKIHNVAEQYRSITGKLK